MYREINLNSFFKTLVGLRSSSFPKVALSFSTLLPPDRGSMFLDLVRFWVRPNWWISLPTLLIHNNDTAGGRDLANFQSTCLTTAKKWLKHIHNESPRNSTHLLIPIPYAIQIPHDALWYSVLKQCINLLREQKQRPCDAPLHLHTIGREGTLNMLMPRKSQVPTCFCRWIFCRENVMNPFPFCSTKSLTNI